MTVARSITSSLPFKLGDAWVAIDVVPVREVPDLSEAGDPAATITGDRRVAMSLEVVCPTGGDLAPGWPPVAEVRS